MLCSLQKKNNNIMLLKWYHRGNCGLRRERKQTGVFALSTSSMRTFILTELLIPDQTEELRYTGNKRMGVKVQGPDEKDRKKVDCDL